MQFQVPQNIAMEDKIVGPLTAIQFGIVFLGGGFSFLVYSSSWIPSPINTILGLTFGLTTLFLAVGKFNDQPMYKFIRFFIAFIFSPKIRVWRKTGSEVNLITQNAKVQNEERQFGQKRISKSDLASLASVLDSRGSQGTISPKLLPDTPGKAKK